MGTLLKHELKDDRCIHCHQSRERCEDGYLCGKVNCNECTLYRHCCGNPPRCDECWVEVIRRSHEATKEALKLSMENVWKEAWLKGDWTKFFQ